MKALLEPLERIGRFDDLIRQLKTNRGIVSVTEPWIRRKHILRRDFPRMCRFVC